MLFSNENVLTPESIQEMYRLHEQIENIVIDGKRFKDICEKVPIADIFQTKRRRRKRAALSRQGKILLGDDDSAVVNDTISDDNDDYYYDDDIWSDYDDYYNEDGTDKEIVKPRIDFKKYGKKSKDILNNGETTSVVDGLPKNIYCDLVQTLNEKCIQTSLLGKAYCLLHLLLLPAINI